MAGSLLEAVYREHRAGVVAAIEEAQQNQKPPLSAKSESNPADALADKLGSLRLNGCEADSSASTSVPPAMSSSDPPFEPTQSPESPTTPPPTPQRSSAPPSAPRSASAPHRRPGHASSHRSLFVPDGSPTAEERQKPLRAYQVTLLSRLTEAWRRFQFQDSRRRRAPPQSVLLYLPTGGGKTRIAAEFMRWHLRRGRRCLFIVNRSKLVSQTEAALAELGCGDDTVGLIKAGRAMNTEKPILVASMQTLRSRFALTDATQASTTTGAGEEGTATGSADNAADVDALTHAMGTMRLGGDKDDDKAGDEDQEDNVSCGNRESDPLLRTLPSVDVVLLDEAHAAGSATYRQLCAAYRARGTFLVGLSATPMRLDPRESLAAVFDRLLVGPSISWLIRHGMLVTPIVLACDSRKVARSLARVSTTIPPMLSGVSRKKNATMGGSSPDFRTSDLAEIYRDGASGEI